VTGASADQLSAFFNTLLQQRSTTAIST